MDQSSSTAKTLKSTESLVSSIPILQRTGENVTSGNEIPRASNRIETFEYEFSVCPVGGTPLFVTLWDTDDLSAAQRACCCNLTKEQIVYSETGNGFFKVRDEDWCFKKEPYQRSWQLHNKVLAEGEGTPEQLKRWDKFTKPPKSSPITADAILATL
jgi:hypothetical protein